MVKYTVQENETFDSIAEKYYGHKRLGKSLCQTNGYKNLEDLKVGDELKLIHNFMAIDPEEPRHEGIPLMKSYPCFAKDLKGGACVHVCNESNELIKGVKISLKADNVEIFSGTLSDGILEFFDIESVSLIVNCEYNGRNITYPIQWMEGNEPFLVQNLTIPNTTKKQELNK